jgi:hypothetical protein
LVDSKFPPSRYSLGLAFSTEVSGVGEDLKHEGWILCDNLVNPGKAQLTRLVGSPLRSKVEELDSVFKMALALE